MIFFPSTPPPPPRSTRFPYTTLFRSDGRRESSIRRRKVVHTCGLFTHFSLFNTETIPLSCSRSGPRSEEHTSELQSRRELVCRLLLEKKKKRNSLSGAYCQLAW